MTVQTLYTAATGMQAMETRLDVIANNLANVETTGFKRDRAHFEDLFYRHEKMPGTQDSLGNPTPTGIAIGLGSKVTSTQSDFEQGSFQVTDNPLDVAIVGQGFFQVIEPSDGSIRFTRAGNFFKNANGDIVMGSANIGRFLEPAISVPPDATEISISAEGRVSVRQPGSQTMNDVGQLELAFFPNAQGLLKVGENLYQETDASGAPTTGTPGQEGLGRLQQGVLEASNVQPVEELIGLITTQRAFELNSKAVQVGDEMMQIVANLKRF